MKKSNLFLMFFLAILLIGSVNAAILTTHSYKNEDLKVEFRTLGLLEKGNVVLKSHSSVTEVKEFGFGKEEVVMYYDFDFKELEKDGLGKVYFEDMRTGKIIEREYKFVIWESIEYKEPVYKEVCSFNIKNNSNVCNQLQSGTETKTKMDWVDYKSKDIKKGQSRIGIKTYVAEHDYIDGVWTIVGEKIERHATWSANLNVGLISSWSFDGSSDSGTFIENGVGNTAWDLNDDVDSPAEIVPGKVGYGGGIDDVGDGWRRMNTNIGTPFSTNEITICLWIYPTTVADEQEGWLLFQDSNIGGSNAWSFYNKDGTRQQWNARNDYFYNTFTFSTYNWYYVCVRQDSDKAITLSRDGATVPNTPYEALNNGDINQLAGQMSMHLGWRNDVGMNGIVDEVLIYNRSLSDAEITQLYNGGDGLSYTDEFSPIVTLNSPADGLDSSSGNITFNYSIEAPYNISNSTIHISNGTDVTTIHGGTTSTTAQVTINNFPEGNYTWNATATDTLNLQGNSTQRSFSVVFIPPTITQNYPADNANFTLGNMVFNCTVNPTNSTIVNASILFNGAINQTNTSGVSGDYLFSVTSIPDDVYNWSCGASDSNGKFDTSDNRTLTIHTTPPLVTVTSPTANLSYIKPGRNVTLAWSVSAPSQNLTEYIQGCSYNYDGTIVYMNNSVCTATNKTSFNYTTGVDNLTFNVTDVFGLTNSTLVVWDVIIGEINLTYDAEVYEGEPTTFTEDIILSGGTNLSEAILVYNGVNHSATVSFSGGVYDVSTTMNAPSVTVATNYSFSYLLFIDGEMYEPVSGSQIVRDLPLGSCTAANNATLLNMSLFDEYSRASMEGNIEIAVTIFNKASGNLVESISEGFTDVSSAKICFSPLVDYPLYLMDAEIRYSADGYTSEFYIVQKADLSDYPLNLSLFPLNETQSTGFLLKYQDDNLVAVEGAVIQLLRKYITNDTYEVVEAPLTSNIGTAAVHVDLDTNLYQAIVSKEGEVLDIFTNIVFNCESELSGQCTQNLFGAIDPRNSVSVATLNDFTYVITSENNTIETTFSIPSGTSTLVNIQLTQVDSFGNSTLCNQTIHSSAGSLECTYNDTIGKSYVYLEIYKNGELQAQQSYLIKEAGGIDWLDNNFFIVLILLLSIVGIGISSPEWIIVIGVSTLVLSGGLFLLNGLDFVIGMGGIIWLILAAGILIFKLAKQEDR